MRYAPLFHIIIEHDYYEDRRCPDFELTPDEAGLKTMRGHQLLFKRSAYGISVLCPLSFDKPLIDISSAVFTFDLVLRQPEFYQYTDLATQATGSIHVFVNTSTGDELKQQGQTEGPLSVFGKIRLQKIAYQADSEKTFVLRFKTKKERWKYVLVTDDPAPDRFNITQSRAVQKDEPLRFKDPVDVKDKVSAHVLELLQRDVPDASKVVTESSEEVPCFQYGRKNLQLKKDNLVLIEQLPSPGLHEGGIKVIKYFKTPNH